ncbi:DUF6171 family protein [Bacillus sp. MRMR6]|uniref:DUF6171 family protein n=1 Tax=Bacillus sp. MRMR6 TaxID=1928617 RepID=UPI0009526881|nr:DUF6171 family protein [Bacillus sp. MRMR6]OLS38405.1 hypothetical protein BTR25_14560 [Bacillus sp. MRMR6]
MSERNLCKGCVDSVIVTEEVIQELVKETEENLSVIVSDEVYAARLKICEGCPSLQYRTTCAHSGCIVRYRAKFKNKSCPFAGKPKWDKVS